MAEFTIETRSHHFLVTRLSARGRIVVEAFAKKYVQWGFERLPGGRFIRAPMKVFAASTKDRSEYRFHINCLEDFKKHLKENFITETMYELTEKPIPPGLEVDLTIQSHWQDRDYQIPAIEYMTDPGPPRLKFVAMQTGKGKSYMAMRAMSHHGRRIVIFIRPMYIDKWIEDLTATYKFTVNDIMVVSSDKAHEELEALLLLAHADQLDAKVIIISNRTMQNWIKSYERFKEETLDLGYACLPDQLFEFIQAGDRLIDEVHQDFHLNFKIDLYTHCSNSISLSATLLADDDFLNRMYEIPYPLTQRYKGPAYDRYIAAKCLFYRLKHPNKVRTKQRGKGGAYSHNVYEQSLMRHSEMLTNYLKLIKWAVEQSYIHNPTYIAGDRLIVFCASIDMCTIVTDYLRKVFPDKSVERYVEQDPYENLMVPDIRVSTLLSAGTAVDIKRLLAVLLTTAVNSSQSNIQGFGRLRPLADGRTPEFWYVACEDIPKHLEYHERKRQLLDGVRALTYMSIRYPLGMI